MGIQNEEIKGSLAIGRDLVTGGGITSRGHSVFDKNVIVKGVLYAKNIKGPCLGLFSSVEQIKKYYPKAREGSYALIGTTIPAEVWHVVDGTWVSTGEKSGEISVDLIDYLTKEEALAEYSTKEELEATQNRCTELLQELEKELSKTIKEGDSALQSTLQVVQTAIDALRGDKQDKLAPGRGIAIIDNVISCTLDTEVFRLVSELPTQDIDENKIYLVAVAGDDAEDNNVYQEWHYKGGAWELIGARKVEVNLTPYLTKDDAIKMYQPKGEYASQSAFDELSETVNVIDEFVGEHTNDRDIHITQVEKAALCIYPFDAIVYNPGEAYGKGYEIAYSVKLKQFISVANDSYTIKGGPYESRDNLYRKGGVLYKFENDTLVEIYQPKGNYDKYVAQTDVIIGGQGFCGVGLTTGEEFDIDTVAAVISGEVGDTSIKDIYCQDGMLFYFRSSGGYQLWRLNDSANAYPVTENNWERVYLMTSKSFVYDESTNTLNIITQ